MELVFITNEILVLLLLFPLVLNFKYYLQTRLKDYLYVSLYFLFIYLAYQNRALELIFPVDLAFRISYSFFYLAIFFMIKIAIRTKWNDIPIIPKSIAYFYLFTSVINLSPITSTPIGNHTLGQYLLNPLMLFSSLFNIYCFYTTSNVDPSNIHAKISRNLWIIYHIFLAMQDIWFYSLVVLPDIPNLDIPLLSILILQLNAAITFLIILTLHIFYPESVLISYQQILRARKLYTRIPDSGNIIEQLGMNRIQNYIEGLPEEIKEEIYGRRYLT